MLLKLLDTYLDIFALRTLETVIKATMVSTRVSVPVTSTDMDTQQHPRSSKPHKQPKSAPRCRTAPRVLLLAVLVAAAVSAVSADAGVFAAGSFAVDMTLSPAAKNRKAGPNSTVGPVPAGVAWDGECCIAFCLMSPRDCRLWVWVSKSRKAGPNSTVELVDWRGMVSVHLPVRRFKVGAGMVGS